MVPVVVDERKLADLLNICDSAEDGEDAWKGDDVVECVECIIEYRLLLMGGGVTNPMISHPKPNETRIVNSVVLKFQIFKFSHFSFTLLTTDSFDFIGRNNIFSLNLFKLTHTIFTCERRQANERVNGLWLSNEGGGALAQKQT